MSKSHFRFVDLFAGIGGFHRALVAEGGRCVLAVERDSDCVKVYKRSFVGTPLEADIRSITCHEDGSERPLHEVEDLVPDHEVLCAGFPCQPFSKSGFQQGVRDRTRGTLFHDVMTIVMAKQPKFVILENVRNIAGPRHRGTWNDIIGSLRDEGYQVAHEPLVLSPHLLAPEDGGAPQVRDRVFILAHRPDVPIGADGGPLFDRRLTLGWNPDLWRIEDYLDDDDQIDELSRYELSEDERSWFDAWQTFVKMIESDDLPGFPIWVDAFRVRPRVPAGTPAWKASFLKKNSTFFNEHRPLITEWMREVWGPRKLPVTRFPESRRKFEWQARRSQPTRSDRDLTKLVLQYRPSGIRVKPATYLPALVAITQTSIVGSRLRRITPREAARLQGMPSDMFERAGVADAAAYKQLGNAVNVGVVRVAARALFEAGNAAWPVRARHELQKAG